MDAVEQVEIYLTLDHPHVARLLMVYEDEQVGGGCIQQSDGLVTWFFMVEKNCTGKVLSPRDGDDRSLL